MKEFATIRAFAGSQDELICFLESELPSVTKVLNAQIALRIPKSKCVETRVATNSTSFREIQSFVISKREQGEAGYEYLTTSLIRRYTITELHNAEVLWLNIEPHFEPAGEECGTIYETSCRYCNLGQQMSDLILDLRRAPQHKDVAETIAWVEWIASSKFVQQIVDNRLSGVQFCPIFEFKNPTKRSQEWHQLKIIGRAGEITDQTLLGRDPFSPGEINWRCPLGHSVAAKVLSEVYLKKDEWGGSDIAVTSSLFGQGRNLLRPTPLIIISQRMYRVLQAAGLKGYSVEVAHLV